MMSAAGERIFESIAKKSYANADPTDYIDEADGLYHCAVCHEPKEYRLKTPFRGREKVGVPCRCERERMEVEEKEQKHRDFMDALSRIHHLIIPDASYGAVMDDKYRQQTFDRDDGSIKRYMSVAHKYAKNFKSLKKHGIGILLSGDVGCGKTFMACCIANYLVDHERYAGVYNFPYLLSKVSDRNTRDDILHSINRYSFVVLDDFGAERGSEYSLEQAFLLIDALENSGTCVCVTTNIPLQNLRETEEMPLRRLYSKVLGLCPVQVSVSASDRRAAISQEKRNLAKEIMTADEDD